MAEVYPTQHKAKLGNTRVTGPPGYEPKSGGDRTLDWDLWEMMLNDSAPVHLRAALIPTKQKEAYFSALLAVLPNDATYTRSAPNGESWRGRYTNSQRLSAIGILGALRDQRAVSPLARQLDDPSNHVRVAIVIALGWIGGPVAVKALIQTLEHPHEPTRAEAARWLGRSESPEAFLPLVSILDDPAESVRIAAIRALAHLKDPRAFSPMMAAFWRHEGMERDLILEELRRCDLHRAVGMFIQSRTREGTARYEAATYALRKLGTPEALAALEDYNHRSTGDFENL